MSEHPLILWLVLGAALVLLLFPRLLRRLTLLLLGRSGREAVGRRALARQPDTITLVPSDRVPSRWAQAVLDGLNSSGFKPAGTFAVKEMGLMPVSLMVRPPDSITAAVYEHPAAGVWYDLYSRFEDGTSLTYSTARLGGGLAPRPGHEVVRLPGLEPGVLLQKFLAARPAGSAKAVTAATAADDFMRSYAESVAWRKRQGISADEVERVGLEPFHRPPHRPDSQGGS